MASPPCQGRTAANQACKAKAKLFDGQQQFCGTHHKVKLRTDPAYVARIEAFKAAQARHWALHARWHAAQVVAARVAWAAGAEQRRLYDESIARTRAMLGLPPAPPPRFVPPPPPFQPDPTGGINLRGFANDSQSVHRSSVISTTKTVIRRLLKRPLAADQRTLVEAMAVLPTPDLRTVLQHDFNMVGGFGLTYAEVLDHVWGTIRSHEHKAELERRFIDEIRDGAEKCHTGKLTRLVNVLAGFDDAVGNLTPQRELFQGRIAMLAKQPLAERESAARDLFHEFAIPEAEQFAWLEPLLEA